MNDIFAGLNEKQLEAVQSTEGYLRVIAGAGSGKTKLLVSRYAYLVREYGIDPANILCVTFTNKAAGEMKRRIRSIIGNEYDTSLICTYHGFCVRVLRDDIEKIFYPKEFQIIDTSQQKEILAEIYRRHELKLDRASFEKILKDISFYKATNRNYVADMCSREKSVISASPLDLVAEYLQKQKEIYALDFSDLLYFTLDIFGRCPDVLKKWQDKLNYIQVDEFQDSSKVEMELIDMLTATHKNLMIVGDPDQNIYEWRGSDVSLLVDFDKTHENTKTVFLNRNYRSTPQILKCANSLIDHNEYRLKKDLFTAENTGIEVVHFHTKSEFEEAEKIAVRIKEIKKTENARYSDFAVLYRSGFLSRIVEKKLTESGIPYEIYGGVKFYQRMEIQDIMAYLKLIAYDGDKAFKRIINTPKRKFGRAKMQRLEELREDGKTLYETLSENLSDPVLHNSGAAGLVYTVEEIRTFASNHDISQVVEKVCSDTGYEKYIRELGDMERFDNLAEFKRIASEYEKNYGESVTLREFIDHISLQSNEDAGEDSDRVKLMTIHAAKGLEFPNVFIIGFSEGIFPSSKTIEERKKLGLEEERRLCYVAITRAEKRLYLLDSEGFTQNGSKKLPSRFLKEIGEDNYRRIGVISKELQAESDKTATVSEKAKKEDETMAVGDEVTHPAFGHGHILSYNEKRRTYEIQFEKASSPRMISREFFENNHTRLPEIKASKEEKPTERAETIREIPEYSAPPSAEYKIKERTDEEYEVREIIKKEVSERREITHIDEEIPDLTEGEKPSKKISTENYDNLWNRDDVPKSGWVCLGVSDLGAPVGVCQMCGHQIIRYVHHMMHPNYGMLDVGCVCAGKMEGDPERAKQREKDFRNRQSRRDNFMKREWKVSRNSNQYLKIKNHLIVLYKSKYDGTWKFSFDNVFSKESFPTRESAMEAAFEALEKAIR